MLMVTMELGKVKPARHKLALSMLVFNLFYNQEWPSQVAKWSLAFHVVSTVLSMMEILKNITQPKM